MNSKFIRIDNKIYMLKKGLQIINEKVGRIHIKCTDFRYYRDLRVLDNNGKIINTIYDDSDDFPFCWQSSDGCKVYPAEKNGFMLYVHWDINNDSIHVTVSINGDHYYYRNIDVEFNDE